MAAAKIKKGDMVVVLVGKDKGRRGKVLRVFCKKTRSLVLVEGVNFVKKHMQPNPQADQQGDIVKKEAPLAISNVALYNPATKKADKVGFRILEDGRKVRYFKSNNEVIDVV